MSEGDEGGTGKRVGGGVSAFCRLQTVLKREQTFVNAELAALADLDEDLQDLYHVCLHPCFLFLSAV